MGNVRMLDMVTIVEESLDHPFQVGDVVKVIQVLDYGCLWVKRADGLQGCIIPSEFDTVA